MHIQMQRLLHLTKRYLAASSCLLIIGFAMAGNHVNILVYHHVANDTPASTSIRPADFRSHLQLLQDEGFTVVDLREALAKLSTGAPLPDKAVAITFDDGFYNIYRNAWPLLREFGYPFAIFVATDSIDQAYGDMMSWDQLRELQDSGAIIANHSSDHGYLVRANTAAPGWLNAVVANIEFAQQRLEQELGSAVPRWFAYPYGEFNLRLAERLVELGYWGFAQHSGGLWAGSHPGAIPRFAAAGIYANPTTLLTKLNSHPLPVNENSLADMPTQEPRPLLNAELLSVTNISKTLNCFVDGRPTQPRWLSERVFQLQADMALASGRHRYNCTARAKAGNFYYWFSKPWLVQPADDSLAP